MFSSERKSKRTLTWPHCLTWHCWDDLQSAPFHVLFACAPFAYLCFAQVSHDAI